MQIESVDCCSFNELNLLYGIEAGREIEEKKPADHLDTSLIPTALIASLLNLLNETTETLKAYSAYCESLNLTTPPLTTDLSLTPLYSLNQTNFGLFDWMIRRFGDAYDILSMIASRRTELKEQKEHWRAFIEEFEKAHPSELGSFAKDLLRDGGEIRPVSQGAGASYFLYDKDGIPRFVVKPVDEDIFCLNNRKYHASPFGPEDSEFLVREGIPLYRSAQTDAFCSELAKLAGLPNATPNASMWILDSDRFYDISSKLEGQERLSFLELTGLPDKEKLCSIQEYIPDSWDLYELTHQWMRDGLSDEEIESRIDQQDFEEVNIFIWLTGDTDAHGGNLRVYVKSIDETGKKIYGIKKIDNGLSMSEGNNGIYNMLAELPNGERPLSKAAIEKILNLPMEEIEKAIESYGLTATKEAFKERIALLQRLVCEEGITISAIDAEIDDLDLDITEVEYPS